MDDTQVAALVERVHEHLAATQELPVERTASRWIGEAEAVAGDLVGAELSDAVLAERLRHVEDLLAEVETTEDPDADEHVEAAKQATREALAALDG